MDVSRIRRRERAGRLAGALATVASMMLGIGVLTTDIAGAVAAAPLPPPELLSVSDGGNGGIDVEWRMRYNRVPVPGGGTRPVDPDGPWGWRINVYLDRTDEHIFSLTSRTFRPVDLDDDKLVRTFRSEPFFKEHGDPTRERYCFRVQGYVGDGTDAGSTFTAESDEKCFGTLKIVVVTDHTQERPAPPPAPTKPDLAVTRVSGPSQAFDGTTAVYDVVLANEGTAANGTAQVTINAADALEPVELVETPVGFACEDHPLGGFSCKGSLGGVDDPVQERVGIFKLQVRGNGSGPASVYGIANHDGALDEMTGDNNVKLLQVTVK